VKQGVLNEKRADLIFQVGSGLFGARKNGKYSEEVLVENAMKPEVNAIELKLAQGAKVRGGKLPKEKITAEIAKIRGADMGHDVESPNRFRLFSDMDGWVDWVSLWQARPRKPVG